MIGLLKMAVATTRLTSLVVEDEITGPLRDKITINATGKPYGSLAERLATLITCPRCVSVWAGFGILAASRFKLGRIAVDALVLSQLALVARDYITHDDDMEG